MTSVNGVAAVRGRAERWAGARPRSQGPGRGRGPAPRPPCRWARNRLAPGATTAALGHAFPPGPESAAGRATGQHRAGSAPPRKAGRPPSVATTQSVGNIDQRLAPSTVARSRVAFTAPTPRRLLRATAATPTVYRSTTSARSPPTPPRRRHPGRQHRDRAHHRGCRCHRARRHRLTPAGAPARFASQVEAGGCGKQAHPPLGRLPSTGNSGGPGGWGCRALSTLARRARSRET